MKNYLIDFVDGTSDDVISAYLSNNQCTVNHVYKNLNKVYHVKSETVPPMDESIITSIIDDDVSAITLLDIVKVKQPTPVTPSRVETIASQEEKNWWKIYSLKNIDLSESNNNVDIFGTNSNIYVLDSGIDITHSEFAGQDISLVYSFTGEFDDTKGHGTSLASVMVGNTCGVTSASLKVVKIFDENQPTKQSDFLHALDAILTDMNNSNNRISIINCSWAINKNIYIEDKLKHLINAGALVVASAGNSGIPIEQVTPASMAEVLTIGAYNSDFAPCDFSNYSNPVGISLTTSQVNEGKLDSWAPGEQIWIAIPASKGGGYGFSAGTSLSAAIYSASLAYNVSKDFNMKQDYFSYNYYADGKIKIEVADVYGRMGLLDLSDSKYTESVNKICTFLNKPNRNYKAGYINERTFHVILGVNTKLYREIFRPHGVDSYEFITPLPQWITMPENDGTLLYHPTNTPTDSTGIDRETFICKIYLEDGTSVTHTLYTAVLGDYDIEALPADDPVLQYGLQAMTGCSQSPSMSCYTNNTCGFSQQCNTSTEFKNLCFCGIN